jgi:hypothetical protein
MPSGFITGALNTAAAEWVHARLMGFDPEKIPLVRESFGDFTYPLRDFSPQSIRVWIADTEISANDVVPFDGRAFRPARGWQGHCELTDSRIEQRTEPIKPQFVRATE